MNNTENKMEKAQRIMALLQPGVRGQHELLGFQGNADLCLTADATIYLYVEKHDGTYRLIEIAKPAQFDNGSYKATFTDRVRDALK